MSRDQSIQREADMRHEIVRYALMRARRSGDPFTDGQHLAEHMHSFRAGARAMAEAIAADIESLRVEEVEALDLAAAGGKVTRFPFPGTEHRFQNWPRG